MRCSNGERWWAEAEESDRLTPEFVDWVCEENESGRSNRWVPETHCLMCGVRYGEGRQERVERGDGLHSCLCCAEQTERVFCGSVASVRSACKHFDAESDQCRVEIDWFGRRGILNDCGDGCCAWNKDLADL